MSGAKINYRIEIKNIGPFEKFASNLEWTGKNKLALYAKNGVGKTFLSRMFRLAETSDLAPEMLLRRGVNNGSFEFSYARGEASNLKKQIVATVGKEQPSQVSIGDDFLFHVFNSDYVDDNIRRLDYTPNGSVEGYIVSKKQIDISQDREKLNEFTREGSSIKKEIEKRLSDLKEGLGGVGVKSSMAAFRELSFDNLVSEYPYVGSEEYSSAFERCKQLEDFPDDPPDISIPPLHFLQVDNYMGVRETLNKTYSRTDLAPELVSKILSNRSFYERGLSQYQEDSDECPFCGQHLSQDALRLISEYESYFADETSKASKLLSDSIESLKQVKLCYEPWYQAYKQSSIAYEKTASIFAVKDKALPEALTPKDLTALVDAAIGDLAKKNQMLEAVVSSSTLVAVEQQFDALQRTVEKSQKLAATLNDAQRKLSTNKTSARKSLCIQAKKWFLLQNAELFANRLSIAASYQAVQRQMTEKSGKIPKREVIATRFEALLDLFFNGKYSFDKKSFGLLFNDGDVGGNASRVLSEGEQVVVAFCCYLAETATLINSENDWDKLFFIIDDPISSLDFDYIYQIAQCIRALPTVASGKTHGATVNVLVLTHNFAFYNLLVANRIVSTGRVLTSEKLETAPKCGILPYDNHLRDVYEIAKGAANPNHTTGNSIRHILECMMHFCEPSTTSLTEYIKQCGELSRNLFVMTYCNDQSHGLFREEVPYNPGDARRACSLVIEFIRATLPGQIEQYE